MRGKLIYQRHRFQDVRNIPAYAGKTLGDFFRSIWNKEHPRVCGENTLPLPPRTTGAGTSPRMRGKLGLMVFAVVVKRNIPAYAGKTSPPGYAHQ